MIQEYLDSGTLLLDTDNLNSPVAENTLYTTRKMAYKNWNTSKYEATIVVLGYNRLEKTRNCVESILKYTENIQYELILIDNGSSDETCKYFESITCENKKVWKITKNIGANFPLTLALRVFEGKYFVYVANDVYVTANWLSNLIKCYESDSQIGMVTPVSSNISNAQEVDLCIKDFDDMQKKAAAFNKHDPTKWKERLRLMPVITIFTREICDVAGTIDLGFYYDFADDDISARIRHAGYKLVLSGDTYVHHDHDYRNMEDKDPAQYMKSLEIGRKNYKDKYFGIDAWDDINNYETLGMNLLFRSKNVRDNLKILGVDVRCGTPLLEIRNHLRERHSFHNEIFAFTSKAKYFNDLQFVTEGHSICDRIEFLLENYSENSFDYIILGEPINLYSQPITLTQHIIRLAKSGGKIIIKLKNVSDVYVFLKINGIISSLDGNMPISISCTDFKECIRMIGIHNITLGTENYNLEPTLVKELEQAIASSQRCKDVKTAVKELSVNQYIFCIEK